MKNPNDTHDTRYAIRVVLCVSRVPYVSYVSCVSYGILAYDFNI